jgi:hypothetical protein
MDNGLVFSISVNTLKDYSITKDKMQVIMTKYILALSKVAIDKAMDQQLSNFHQTSGNSSSNRELDKSEDGESRSQQAMGSDTHRSSVVSFRDEKNLQRKKTGTGGMR